MTGPNYGAIIDGFTAKYGIKVNSENPDGSSGDEINAVKSTKGQPSAPDVVDIGNSYALSGAQDNLFAPYKVATWADIPDGQKDAGRPLVQRLRRLHLDRLQRQEDQDLPEDDQGPGQPGVQGRRRAER